MKLIYEEPKVPQRRIETIDDLKNALLWLGIESAATTTFAGFIQDDGTVGFLPAGWTAERTGQGIYVVTHNLGHSNYAVSPSQDDASVGHWTVAYTTTTFTVRMFNASASLTDYDFHFIVATN